MSETVDPVELSNRIIDTGNPEPPHNRVLDELVEVEDEVAEVAAAVAEVAAAVALVAAAVAEVAAAVDDVVAEAASTIKDHFAASALLEIGWDAEDV